MPRRKATEEDGKPEFEPMPLYQISPEGWMEMERNRQNLIDAGLWFSMKVVFEPQNDHRLRAFMKGSCYGAVDEVQIMDQLLPFDIDAISRCLRLPQEGMNISSVVQYTDEDLEEVFEPHARTASGYLLSKAKGVWRVWLPYINNRILLPQSKDHISEEGVGAALMVWNGMPLNWSKIVYNNIKVELMRKKTRGTLSLYSAVYLTKLMDPTQPRVPIPETVNLTIPMEVGSTSRSKKRKENEAYYIRMRTRNVGGSSTLQLDSEEEERTVNVVSVTAEETLREVRQTVAQQLSYSGSKESEACRVIEVFGKRYTLLANSKKRVEEEKVKIAAELELRKRAFVNLTLEMEELREEFKVYKELPSTLKQCQLDNDQLKEELHKLQAEYQKVTDSLVYHTSLKKDLNKEFFHMHKENEGLKHQMELLRIRHHENLQEVWSTRQSAETRMLQEREQQVILVTKERDEVQARVEVLSRQVTSQFDRFQTLIWNHKLLSPPSFSLFRAYELQRNLLLKVLDLERGCQLDSSNFERVWRITKDQLNQHNLVCEMIARGDFVLMDPEKLVLPIGNLGARVTLYYLNLEGQLHNKRYSDSSEEEHREVKIPEFNNILLAVPEHTPEQLQSWKDVLTKLHTSFSSQDSLQVKLTYVHQREAVAQ
jgi:hypothetical protein